MKDAEPTLAPSNSISAIIALYQRDTDRTLIRENLKLTVEERLRNLQKLQRFAEELREAGRRLYETRAIKLRRIDSHPILSSMTFVV